MAYTRLSDANEITARYIDSILFEERLIDSEKADLTTTLFGETFSSPVLMPAFSHLGKYGDRELTGLEEYSIAAKEKNILNFVGMMENEMFGNIIRANEKTVRIVKPYADNAKVIDQLQFAYEVGAFAVGMDIDHIFGMDGYDVVVGEEMAAQTMDMLHTYVTSVEIPFIVKGVLSVSDAIKCEAIGAKGIIVSHHHGRLPYAVPPMMVLPEIKEALRGKGITIMVDCGLSTGSDIYKALALGADAAAVGRTMLPHLEKGGVEGVKKYLDEVDDELRFVMSSTGFKKTSFIDDSALIINPY